MSEHQYVAFRAIDRPVGAKNLEYMRQQSSRAEITPWSFDNEYHYGDFRGDALEMLRRGYDIHLHYANYGIRKLLLRFPHGLTDERAAKPYFDKEGLQFLKDKQGVGGTLCIKPYHEPGYYDDYLNFEELLERLPPLRAEILEGDLRPLYLAHLVMAFDDNHPPETKEAPVPAGLEKLTDAQKALSELYCLGDALVAAAAKGCPAPLAQDKPGMQSAQWLQAQSPATKDAWLTQLMSEDHANVRTDLLTAFRKDRKAPAWPTVRLDRTLAELETAAETIEQEMKRRATEKATMDRQKKLADMAVDPAATLRETETLVKHRSTDNYRKAASLLADLREALAGTKQAGLADKQALKLRKANPTLGHLVGALRREGFLPK